MLFFDFAQKKISKLISLEIESGGKFEELVFPVHELNMIHVIQFSKENKDHGIVSGLGADEKIEMAYLKAIVEYFERMAYLKTNLKFNISSTNGIAAHRLGFKAKLAAKNERLERDSFLRHWYSNTSFIPLDLNNYEISLNNVLRLNNLEFFLGKTFLGYKETMVCFLKDKTTNGFVLGLSCGRGRKDRDKAIQEALINYYFGGQGLSADEQVEIVQKEGINSLESHRAYWLYLATMPSWPFDHIDYYGTKKKNPSLGLEPPSNYLLLESTPFSVFYCKNDDLIDLQLGDACKIYPDSLTRFGINILSDLTRYHPIP